jgi:hypothetical protein
MPIEKDGIILEDSERQECEIWTRVMGYYRPISDFNIGKRGEYEERRPFKISSAPEVDHREADDLVQNSPPGEANAGNGG